MINFCSPIINIQAFKTQWVTHLQDVVALNFFPGCLCNWYFLEYIASALVPGTPSWQHLARQRLLAVSPGYLCLLLSPNLEECSHLDSFLLDQLHAAKSKAECYCHNHEQSSAPKCVTILWHKIGGGWFCQPAIMKQQLYRLIGTWE